MLTELFITISTLEICTTVYTQYSSSICTDLCPKLDGSNPQTDRTHQW